MQMQSLKAIAVLVGLTLASPASAAVYNYKMSNGDVLSIDTIKQFATFTGQDIRVAMKSEDFGKFSGGSSPNMVATLSALYGKRVIDGHWVSDNPKDIHEHPQKLILDGHNVNLWAWWGDPISGGDYLTTVTTHTSVPEPGVAGLMIAGVGGLALARRRRKQISAA